MSNQSNPALVDLVTDFLVGLGRPYPTRALSEADIREMVQQHRHLLHGIMATMPSGDTMAWEFSGRIGTVIMNEPGLLESFLERGVVASEGDPPIASADHLTKLRAFRDIADKTQRALAGELTEIAVVAVIPSPTALSMARH